MWHIIKRLSLGLLLIGLAAAILLISDQKSRQRAKSARLTPGDQPVRRVALLQHASTPILDDAVQGMVAALAEKGFVDGKTMALRKYNAEGDLPVANSIAKEMISGQYDLILTASTPSLQTVANANQAGKTKHVFVAVTDPYGAGVGINRTNHLDHPRHLAGYGTMQPVEASFRLARRLRAELKTVGVVWNPAEANSEAQVKLARLICQELGIQLLEATVENSSGVFEAASALTSRGVGALWMDGDITVMAAVDSLAQAAKRAGIPLFTVAPPSAERGSLFDLGANYIEVGRLGGLLAAEILAGRDPATVSIDNQVPNRLVVNKLALRGLKEAWSFPEEVLRQAEVIIDETGTNKTASAVSAIALPQAGRSYKMGLVYFAPEPGVDSCMEGLFAGLRELGFEEGKNLVVRKAHAQGEIAQIPAILQNFDNQDLDLIIPMSTPCLTAACGLVKKKPVVFSYCYDPIAAGAGKSFTDHLPRVTGIGSFPPLADTIDLIQRLVPGVQRVGTLYNSSEANSRKVIEVARDLFLKRGIALEEVAIAGSSEVYQAAQALAARRIQALWITGDNTALQAFEGIVKVALGERLPLIINDPEFVERGALAGVGIGFYQSGYATAKLVARVLLGESPQRIPIENVAVKAIVLNHELARKWGIVFPADILKSAQAPKPSVATVPPPVFPPLTKKWQLRLIEFNQVLDVEEAEKGILDGLGKAGLVKGRDYEIKVSNAQGEMATVSSLVDAAITDGADLLITLSTPTLQAALRRAGKLPVVFTYCASAVAAGAGRTDTDHLPNVTGVPTTGAYDELIQVIRECLPAARTLGTLFVPSEVNTVFHKDKFAAAAKKAGLEFIAVPAETSVEVPDAAMALCQRKIDAICQIPGNLTAASFPSIARAARTAKIPLFASQVSQAASGPIAVVSRDYYEAGLEASGLVARILRGESPSAIPFQSFSKTKILLNPAAAKASGLTVPDSLRQRATELLGEPVRPSPKSE